MTKNVYCGFSRNCFVLKKNGFYENQSIFAGKIVRFSYNLETKSLIGLLQSGIIFYYQNRDFIARIF